MGDVFRFHSLQYDSVDTLAQSGFVKLHGGGTTSCTMFIDSGTGPFGENVMRFNYQVGSLSSFYRFPLPTPGTYLSIGAWCRLPSLSPAFGVGPFLWATMPGTSRTWSFGQTSGNPTKLILASNVGGVTTTTPTISTDIVADQWFHFQLDIHVASTGSFMKLRLNGQDDAEITWNPGSEGNNVFDGVNVGNFDEINFANFWAAYGGYKGQCIARALLPVADSSVQLQSTEETNYGAVADTPVIDEASYVFEDTNNFPVADKYTVETQTDTPVQMHAFSVTAFGSKSYSDVAVLRGLAKYGSSADDLSDTYEVLGLGTTGKQFIWNNHPDGVSGAISGLTGLQAQDMINNSVFGVHLANTL